MKPAVSRLPSKRAADASLPLFGGRAAPASDSPLGLIGLTPMASLNKIGEADGVTVLAKLENENPGGSVKDRTALGMILDARERGVLTDGQRLVEATAGNTGIGLALVGRAFGHEVVTVIPERYCPEKLAACRAVGAHVVTVPGDRVGMKECRVEAQRLVDRDGGIILDQFNNAANPDIHEQTTGPEMWEQCEGEIDAVVLGVGTGGTFTGVVRYLRTLKPDLPAFVVENQASILGGGPGGVSKIEGIGNSFFPDNFDQSLVSGFIRVSDEDALAMMSELAGTEGLLAGGSGAAAVFASLDVGRRLGRGSRVLTLIADGAERSSSLALGR